MTEVWINNSHDISELLLPGFQSPLLDPKARGGACIYVRNGLQFAPVFPPHISSESVWIQLKTSDNISRLYACIYRSPNSDTTNDNNLLMNIDWAKQNFREIIITGDFNLPSINWSTNSASGSFPNNFLDCVNNNSFEQLIQEPTRFREDQNPSLLDLILVSDPDMISNINVGAPFGKSDHSVINFSVNNKIIRHNDTKIYMDYSKLDILKFDAKFMENDWAYLFNISDNIDKTYEEFIEAVEEALNASVPKKTVINNSKAPWVTKHVAKLSVKKRRSWDRFKNTRTPRDYEIYKIDRNIFNEAKLSAIRRYENNIIANKKVNRKQYYRYISRNKKYLNNCITLMNDNGILESNEQICADILNDHFSSVFTLGDSLIPNSDTGVYYPEMNRILFTESAVFSKLKNIDISKSHGPDDIPGCILKNCSDIFAPILTKLFNKIYECGTVPSCMKLANVVPIHKKGDRSLKNNYRPVSLTPIIAKIFESFLYDNIIEHMRSNRIITDKQHGFLKNHSTNTNLLYFWEDITTMADNTKEFSVIYTDFSKAFDSVPHDLLLFKLGKYGISGINWQCLRSFLRGRKQRVMVNNKFSKFSEVKSGVPQGGVLSGLLFILYINDLPNIFQKLKIYLYADDAKFYGGITNENSINEIQDDLNRLSVWCHKWRLNLNADKCFFIHYKPRFSTNNFPSYSINGTSLRQNSCASDLGIIINENLKFHDQVEHACKRATKEINIIRRTFLSRCPKFLANMYKMFVRPHLEYCIQVWNPMYQGDINKMEKIQNRFSKLLRQGSTMSPDERNRTLGITSHETRRLRGDLIYIYKLYNSEELFRPSTELRTRGNSKKLAIPSSRIDVRKHSFTVRNVAAWNQLPNDIVCSPNLNTFKSRLDCHLGL